MIPGKTVEQSEESADDFGDEQASESAREPGLGEELQGISEEVEWQVGSHRQEQEGEHEEELSGHADMGQGDTEPGVSGHSEDWESRDHSFPGSMDHNPPDGSDSRHAGSTAGSTTTSPE